MVDLNFGQKNFVGPQFYFNLLICFNALISIFGLWKLGWGLNTFFVAYMVEGVFLVFFAIIKLIISNRYKVNPNTSAEVCAIFVGMLAVVLFGALYFALIWVYLFLPREISFLEGFRGAKLLIISFFVVHLVSFVTNFILKKEYLTYSPEDAIGVPIFRMLPLNIVIFSAILFSGNFYLYVFIFIKLMTDWYLHSIEHRDK